MRRILLVDAAPAALAQLQQALQVLRPQWQTASANSARAAMVALSQRRFDAVISDIGGAALDGSELLALVRDGYPNVVRLCLSDHSDDDAFLRAVPVTHQFFGKPCNVENLCEVLERICSLRDILRSGAIQQLIGNLKALPATPADLSGAVGGDRPP